MKKNSFWIKSAAMIGTVIALFALLLLMTKEYRQAIRGMSAISYFNFNPVALLWLIVVVGLVVIGVLVWLAKMIFDREQLLTEAAMEVRKVTNNIHAGVVNFDLVAFIFGEMSWLARVVYTLVGLAGIYLITFYGFLNSSEE